MSQMDADPAVGDVEDEEVSLLPFPSGWLTFAFYTFLLVWDIGMLLAAWPWTWQNKLMPVLVGVVLAVLITIHLIRLSFPDVFERFESRETNDDGGEFGALTDDNPGEQDTLPKPVQEKYQLLVSGWIVALAVFIYLFGFVLVLPLFLFGFIWYFKRDAKQAGIITVAFSLLIYLLFVVVLKVRLWPGAVF